MDGLIDVVMGWGTIVLVIVVPIVLGGAGIAVLLTSRPLEQRYSSSGGGLAGGFANGLEAAFSPSAHEAGVERDRQTRRTAPAPTPGDPPWEIDGDRIRIEV
ncbi:hypothetical protein [Microbacterium sp. NPDC058345]|uniref:hypothetical protein n=1 Tax=Microbacterium sp. NPDC058345 TaxID=3346455 RepID=UPI003658205B